jgi:AcrR family transcriptional regulator
MSSRREKATPTQTQASRGTRPPRADALRNEVKLIEAGTKASAEHGVNAPLEEVAQRAGLRIGTLYRHFPSREALVAAVYRHDVDMPCIAADELLATSRADEALGAWMTRFVAHVSRKRGMANALKSMMGAEAALLQDCRRQMIEAIERLLAAAAAEGGVRSDIGPSDVPTGDGRHLPRERIRHGRIRHGARSDSAPRRTADRRTPRGLATSRFSLNCRGRRSPPKPLQDRSAVGVVVQRETIVR